MSQARSSRRRVGYLLEAPVRRRRLLIAPALLLSLATLVLGLLLPARYRAAAMVGVEWGAFDPTASRRQGLDPAELRTQAVRLRVTERALLERTLEETTPYAGVGGASAVTDAQVERVRSDLRVRPMATSSFVIEFEHGDPAKAALVPNVLVRRLVQAKDGQGPVARFELLTPARTPDAPESSNPAVYGLVGALVGLLLGLGAALVAEARDRSVKGPEDLEQILPVPLLATLPEVRVPERRA
jgi:uncharacterized protein involved in exopolysaccharide biosynthesis